MTTPTIRKIPFDLAHAIGVTGGFSPYWHHEKSSSLLGLGYSFFLEFFELFYNAFRPALLKFIHSPQANMLEQAFHRQEMQHAKYHKILNEYLLGGRTRRIGGHPRVYDFLIPIYQDKYAGILGKLNAADTDDHSPHDAVCAALKIIAMFESQTCVSSFVFFETLFDNNKVKYSIRNSQNLGVLYLLGYHFAEELEHCGIVVNLYEQISGQSLFDGELSAATAYGLDDEALIASLAVAEKFNLDIEHSDLLASSFYRLTSDRKNQLLVPGFHPDNPEILGQRNHLVERWDRDWAPSIQQSISLRC